MNDSVIRLVMFVILLPDARSYINIIFMTLSKKTL